MTDVSERSTSAPGIATPAGSPWHRSGWLVAAAFLPFLWFPVRAALESGAGVAARGGTVTVLGVFGLVYLLGFTRFARRRRVWGLFGVMVVLALATVPVIGIATIGLTPYFGAYAAFCLPAPAWRWTAAAVAVVPTVTWLVPTGDFPAFFVLIVWPVVLGCGLVRELTDREDAQQRRVADLELVAERERVARDVHDVLGHSLTVLTVKTELAERLLDVDPERARTELGEIRAISREALAEVRATVGGLRAGSLADELARASDVLADAGVAARVHGEVTDTDPRHRVLLGWVLREALTNVVRHAGATRATITVFSTGVEVVDDGIGGTDRGEGTGLRGMRERVEAAGGRLEVGPASPADQAGPAGSAGTRVAVVLS